jgi:hypothetical protein
LAALSISGAILHVEDGGFIARAYSSTTSPRSTVAASAGEFGRLLAKRTKGDGPTTTCRIFTFNRAWSKRFGTTNRLFLATMLADASLPRARKY